MADSSSGATLRISAAELSSLIHELYVGATKPPQHTDFLRRCCTMIDAAMGGMTVCDRRDDSMRYVDFFMLPSDSLGEYLETYFETDPLKLALAKHPSRRFYLLGELLAEEVIRTHPYFTVWYEFHGYSDVCCASFPMGEHYYCNIGFTRATGKNPFTRREIEFLDLLLPHIEESLQLYNMMDELALMSDLALEHLSQAGAGFIVLNERGQVRYMNRIAQTLVSENLRYSESEGLIRFAEPQLQAQFTTLVRNCIGVSKTLSMHTGGVISMPRPGKPPLGVMVLPYRTHAGYQRVSPQDRRATVTLFDPSRPRMDAPVILRDLYQLNESEVQLCWRLANGETLEEIAVALETAKETLRSQLKRVFTKTGTSRQSELVRLVLVGPALWATIPRGPE